MLTTRRSFMVLGASALSLGLAGCLGATPPVTFDLTSASGTPMRRRSSRVVVITLPKTVQTYDSQRVVVREAGNVLSYLPEAQLSDTLPRLVQTRLLQTFEASNFPNIGRPDDQLRVDVTLATELQAFEIDVASGNLATVTINAKLVDETRGMIFASKSFTATQPAATNPAAAAIAGLDGALKTVMSDILQWTARTA
ncbi:ABC-type transport auxiliary lipoprotein family protein [Devosia aquimaris]|uniref:ABC-type transport auxiliary lipoprotein family protein n=1 Tax=Devosia aquimaris TaxID=2866214 RepID=UPI001CD05C7C|nr:ABC-type transport auxiliary lipoprotein family protein [Devosia sp. CJK-A8-3]